MSMPAFFSQAAKIRSVAPVMVAQFRLPGCAFAMSASSLNDLMFIDCGALSVTTVALMRATGDRSLIL